VEQSPISVRIPDAVKMTGLSRSTIYELIRSGDIEIAKVGASTLIIVASLKRFIERSRILRGED
jgi:excisionase family DNA binding protein